MHYLFKKFREKVNSMIITPGYGPMLWVLLSRSQNVKWGESKRRKEGRRELEGRRGAGRLGGSTSHPLSCAPQGM